MHKDEIYAYNQRRKLLYFFLTILIITAIIAFGLWYFFALRFSTNPIILTLNAIFSHIIGEIKERSILAVIYTSLIGGLFFITVPTETAYIAFLTKGHNPWLVAPIYISGFVLSYTANYYIGRRIAGFAKKIISPRKFYKIKGYLNRFGGWVIFVFNVLPLPSQALSAILGVFKYNKTRFYVYFITGQIIKYAIISTISIWWL